MTGRWWMILTVCACTRGGSSDQPAATAAANFQLVCDSADSKESSSLFCVRHDTRNGDVKRVLWDQLPVSQGSTKGADGMSGRFTLSCRSTHNEVRSDFYCIRLDTTSGEMLMVQLPKVGTIPDEVAPQR